MYRVKQLLGGRLSLRNYNAQVGETYAMIKALNKLTGLGMPENSVCYIRITQLQAVWCSDQITQQSWWMCPYH
ncbi:putative transposase [Vibrio parahaemolyticus]|nr:putative transposase [Vibrio parahaemolyticus]